MCMIVWAYGLYLHLCTYIAITDIFSYLFRAVSLYVISVSRVWKIVLNIFCVKNAGRKNRSLSRAYTCSTM